MDNWFNQYSDERKAIGQKAQGNSQGFGDVLNAVRGAYPTLSTGMANYDAKYFRNNGNQSAQNAFSDQFTQGQNLNRQSNWQAQQSTQSASPNQTTGSTDPYQAWQQNSTQNSTAGLVSTTPNPNYNGPQYTPEQWNSASYQNMASAFAPYGGPDTTAITGQLRNLTGQDELNARQALYNQYINAVGKNAPVVGGTTASTTPNPNNPNVRLPGETDSQWNTRVKNLQRGILGAVNGVAPVASNMSIGGTGAEGYLPGMSQVTVDQNGNYYNGNQMIGTLIGRDSSGRPVVVDPRTGATKYADTGAIATVNTNYNPTANVVGGTASTGSVNSTVVPGNTGIVPVSQGGSPVPVTSTTVGNTLNNRYGTRTSGPNIPTSNNTGTGTSANTGALTSQQALLEALRKAIQGQTTTTGSTGTGSTGTGSTGTQTQTGTTTTPAPTNPAGNQANEVPINFYNDQKNKDMFNRLKDFSIGTDTGNANYNVVSDATQYVNNVQSEIQQLVKAAKEKNDPRYFQAAKELATDTQDILSSLMSSSKLASQTANPGQATGSNGTESDIYALAKKVAGDSMDFSDPGVQDKLMQEYLQYAQKNGWSSSVLGKNNDKFKDGQRVIQNLISGRLNNAYNTWKSNSNTGFLKDELDRLINQTTGTFKGLGLN